MNWTLGFPSDVESVYQDYIYHISIQKGYRYVLAAFMIAWAALIIIDIFYFLDVESAAALAAFVTEVVFFLFIGVLLTITFTRVYERVHVALHYTCAVLLTVQAITVSVRAYSHFIVHVSNDSSPSTTGIFQVEHPDRHPENLAPQFAVYLIPHINKLPGQ